MTSIINILMIIGMALGFFTNRLSIIVSILCFITSIFCFCQSFKRLGDDTTPSKRDKIIQIVTIDGFSISIIGAIALLNIVIYNFKLLIVFLVLSIAFSSMVRIIKFIKKNYR